MNFPEKYRVLKEAFGYDAFRDGQEPIIDGILSRRDVLAVMPTGAGKSVCYQVPALLFPGVTLVISPLISLMKDQVSSLEKSGIPAAYINSSLDQERFVATLRGIRSGKYKLIYIAPERLTVPAFVEMCCSIDVAFVAVDEAHCISQWGHDFRPDYMRIAGFLAQLPQRPVVGAFTATATPRVRSDIRENLQLVSPLEITLTFNRPNLYFAVKSVKDREAYLRKLIRDRKDQSGIVYCATRKTVETICRMLNDFNIPAGMYHAGLSPEKRNQSQEDFLYDRVPVMVATNAFGMGIDKSNVSYVIHYNMPKTLEAYYQEAGRAGRDGEPADCVLLYSGQDVHTQKWFIEHSEPNPALTEAQQEEVRERDYARLARMAGYCSTSGCLREYILNYFGEKTKEYCGNCSNCLGKVQAKEITIEAQKIMSCVKRTGERHGSVTVAKVLHGSEEEKLLSQHLHEQSTYGIMKDVPIADIRTMISSLVGQGFLQQSGAVNPVLALTKASWPVLKGQEQVFMKVDEEKAEPENDSEAAVSVLPGDLLYLRLRQLRMEIAREEGVPAFVVFSDATLRDICTKQPQNKAEFRNVSGIGEFKAEKYGARFLKLLQELPRPEPSLRPVTPSGPKQNDTSGFVSGVSAVWNAMQVQIISRSGDIVEIQLPDGTRRRVALSVAIGSNMIRLI